MPAGGGYADPNQRSGDGDDRNKDRRRSGGPVVRRGRHAFATQVRQMGPNLFEAVHDKAHESPPVAADQRERREPFVLARGWGAHGYN